MKQPATIHFHAMGAREPPQIRMHEQDLARLRKASLICTQRQADTADLPSMAATSSPLITVSLRVLRGHRHLLPWEEDVGSCRTACGSWKEGALAATVSAELASRAGPHSEPRPADLEPPGWISVAFPPSTHSSTRPSYHQPDPLSPSISPPLLLRLKKNKPTCRSAVVVARSRMMNVFSSLLLPRAVAIAKQEPPDRTFALSYHRNGD